MKKPGIPAPRPGADPALIALKESMEIVTGQRGIKINTLGAKASASDIINAINGILELLQNTTVPLVDSNTEVLNKSSLIDISAAGAGQIKFPAQQNSSADPNTLDDYEEGTFTATLIGGTTNPTTPVTTTGTYVKVGRMVTVNVAFTNITTTGAAGIVGFSGLPFACSEIALGSCMVYSIGTWAGSPVVYVPAGDIAWLYASNSGAVWNGVQHAAGAARYLWATVTYLVAT